MTPADRTRRILREVLGVSEDQIMPEATLESLGADSLDSVKITITLETEFDIEISDDDALACTTVGDWTKLVEGRVG